MLSNRDFPHPGSDGFPHRRRAETERRLIFELGNGQWNLPKLRTVIEEIIRWNGFFDNFEVEHTFEQIGRRTMT